VFRLDERRYQPMVEFKFVLAPGTWMVGENLKRAPAEGATYDFGDDAVLFKPVPALVTENAQVQRTLFKRNLDEAHEYEVLVVGSGIGGGILADQLADLGADVLVLEAGSYLFPTHVANLPRRLRVGRFDKSVWGLFPDFSFANYVNVDGSAPAAWSWRPAPSSRPSSRCSRASTTATSASDAGLTDHPILYTHFALPAGSPHAATGASAKIWSRHRDTSVDRHAYNVVLELGADFNQGRYVDPDNLARQRAEKGDQTLCEIVFLFNAPLLEGNFLELAGPPAVPVRVNVQPYRPPGALRAEVAEVAATVLQGLEAVPLVGEDLVLREAALGGVAHEVGTLRMADDGTAAVDQNLRFLGYDNLYACDNSVFPSSPAANPTLALTALALRLARQLTGNP
jgi:hypothetical protein